MAIGMSRSKIVPISHAALFFKSNSGTIRVLHYQEEIEAYDPVADEDDNFAWATPGGLEPEQVTQICELCAFIETIKPRIRYGFGLPTGSKFDKVKLSFIAGPGSTGLTCSTFVALIFQEAGAPLVKYEEWPDADSRDLKVRTKAITDIRDRGRPDVAQRLEKEVNTPRLSPEQIVGACLFDSLPVGYKEACEAGEHVLAELGKYYDRVGIVWRADAAGKAEMPKAPHNRKSESEADSAPGIGTEAREGDG